MKVAITGSSGLIGTALAEALVARGDHVVPVVRRERTGDEIRWDPRAGTIDGDRFAGLDAVVHLAGEGIAEKRWSDEQKRRILESRRQGTGLLARTLAELGDAPPILVSASAIGIYGDRGDEVLDESTPAGEGFLPTVVTEWERAADPARHAGIRVAHPRIGLVQSTDGGALAEQLPLFKLGLGGKLGDGSQWWSWVTIDDTVRAICWMIDAEFAGVANVTAPNPVTNATYTDTLGSVLGRPTFLRPPRFALYARLGRELTENLLFTSARVVPTALTEAGFEFHHPQLEAALRQLLGR